MPDRLLVAQARCDDTVLGRSRAKLERVVLTVDLRRGSGIRSVGAASYLCHA
jgi:hypothetical protein